MRIVLVGAVQFSAGCLQTLLDLNAPIVGVIGLSPIKADRHGDYVDLRAITPPSIPSCAIENINSPEALLFLRVLQPDLIGIFGWSQIIKPDVLTIAPCLGTHPSLLPKYRGRHPLTWQLVNGETEGGLTFFWINDGLDTGPIAWQRGFPITGDDDAHSLYGKMQDAATDGLRTLLPQLLAGTAPHEPQVGEPTYNNPRTTVHQQIDWNARSRDVVNLVRGLTHPYVGAQTTYRIAQLTIWKATNLHAGHPVIGLPAPGTVVTGGTHPVIRTGDGYVALVDVSPRLDLQVGDTLGTR